ncbi:MAG: D-alanine--D-alanine ligase [Planctomycetes bacterium]|nr:D-alanine--D-alanine ligase [Planctomycetota bacterium]
MRICLLTTQDLDAETFAEDDWPCDPRPFLPDEEWHLSILTDKASAPDEVRELLKQDFDLFFNLCDGAADQDDLPGIEVVHVLEESGRPFTGSTSHFYEPTRIQMKEACAKLGIAYPRYVVAQTEEDVERAASELTFPLFVKHASSYASVDLSRHSKVTSVSGLKRQAQKIMNRHGAALIEEFVEGGECTVLVAENPADPASPITYTPIEYKFPKGESFKHAKLKWEEFEGLSAAPVADTRLSLRLREECARFFVAMGGASFGRCDIRIAKDGTPYMLEINANCGIYYPIKAAGSADICLMMDPAGHAGFTRQLIEAAFARQRRNRMKPPSWVTLEG